MQDDSDPLAALRDIHLPADPTFWPPAPGWWLVIGLLLMIIALVSWQAWRRWLRLRPVRSAQKILTALHEQLREGAATPALAAELSTLIRRLALWRFSNSAVAGLTGPDWLRFLDRTLGDTQFSQGPGRWLLTAPYAPSSTVELSELLALTQRWISAIGQPATKGKG